MFRSGAGRDKINYLVLVIISSKSDNVLDGGLQCLQLEKEDGILVREGVLYVTVFDKVEERTG